MKNILLIIVASLPVFGFTGHYDSKPDSHRDSYILKITSANPEREVAFEASYVTQVPGKSIQHFSQKTPMTFSVDSKMIYGFFQKLPGDGEITVALYYPASDENGERMVYSGTSTNGVIVVLDDFSPRGESRSYVRTF